MSCARWWHTPGLICADGCEHMITSEPLSGSISYVVTLLLSLGGPAEVAAALAIVGLVLARRHHRRRP